MKKVLIIAYYWPPSGSSAVQRAVKFAKYLPDFGWQPVVLTVNKGQYNALDESFDEEISELTKVYRTKALEPHNVYRLVAGLKKQDEIPVDAMTEKNASLAKKLAFWFRVNLFIPDSRIGWIPYAVAAGKKVIKKENIDLIFSTSPPPTVHLIAKKLAKWSGLKWVADFRDPWTNIHYLKETPRTKLANKIDSLLEKKVLTTADAIISVSQYDMEKDFRSKISEKNKVHYIPNGYDEDDFARYVDPEFGLKNNGKFKIGHIGTLNDNRIPENLFNALSKLKKEKKISSDKFCLYLIGQISNTAVQLIKALDVEDIIKIVPYLPHPDIFNYYEHLDALLLLTYKSPANIPGKTFEYLRANKPILMIGRKQGEAARVLSEIRWAEIAEYDDEREIIEKLLKVYQRKDQKGQINADAERVQFFERKNLTGKLAAVFEKLSGL